jgi:small subunit ribosomal protein S10
MLVDKSAEKDCKTVKSTGAVVTGPIPLPTHKNFYSATFSTLKQRDLSNVIQEID